MTTTPTIYQIWSSSKDGLTRLLTRGAPVKWTQDPGRPSTTGKSSCTTRTREETGLDPSLKVTQSERGRSVPPLVPDRYRLCGRNGVEEHREKEEGKEGR